MEWISVGKYLPGMKSDWVIVRCVDKDLCDFYFMASFCEVWQYFDDDKEYFATMRVTHWAYPDKVEERDYFIKDGEKITEPNL